MPAAVLTTKLFIPSPRSDAILRPRLVERRGLLSARERELPADLVVGVAVDEAPSVSLELETGQRLALFPRSRFRAGVEAQRQDVALINAALRGLTGLPPA